RPTAIQASRSWRGCGRAPERSRRKPFPLAAKKCSNSADIHPRKAPMTSMRRDGATARTAPIANDTAALERPTTAGVNAPMFGSDVAADALRALDVPYIALNPGASFRGLHDSIVNYLGNSAPQMLLCLHEEAAVAIAHGYAKVTDRAMAAAVHSNVGLMH